MNQQISVDDALEAFRKRHGELADENTLLRARVAGLERELNAAHKENEQLMNAATAPTNGPDLAAQPPYRTDEQR